MAWQQTLEQTKKFSGLLRNQITNIKEFTEHPKHLLSLSSQFSSFKALGKRSNYYVEPPTSGESSPCLSESGRRPRYIAPSVFDVHDFLIDDETFSEVDYNLEELKDCQQKMSLLIEGLEPTVTIDKILALMSEVKVYTSTVNCIFDTRKYRFITFKGKHCLLLHIQIKNSLFFAKYIRKLQMHIKSSMGYAVGISVTKKPKHLNGVVLRSLPPKVTQGELLEQCAEEVDENISIGPIYRIKQSQCCVIDCKYLEDAEVICKKINRIQVKDSKSQENCTIKAHIYPQNTLKYRKKEKSIFADSIHSDLNLPSSRRSVNSRRTQINRILDILANSKNQEIDRTPLMDLTHKAPLLNDDIEDSVLQQTKLNSQNRRFITSHI